MVSVVGCCAGIMALVPGRPGYRLALQGWAYRRPWRFPLALLALVAGVSVITVMPLSVMVSAVIVAITGWLMARSVLGRKRRERRRHQVSTVLNLVAHQLRSGAEPGAALRSVVQGHRDIDAELGEQLLVLSTTASGTVDVPELRTVARVWEAARHHGIALAPLLGRVHSTLDKELRHSAATRARLMGPQSTAVVLAFLPLGGVGLGTMMGAHPVGLLLGGGLGDLLLLAGITLLCCGALWSQALIERAGGN